MSHLVRGAWIEVMASSDTPVVDKNVAPRERCVDRSITPTGERISGAVAPRERCVDRSVLKI